MNAHAFCRELLKAVIGDTGLRKIDFSITHSSLGGYEVAGPDRFYHYANSACCKWSAMAEGMEHFRAAKEVELLS